MSTFDRNLPRSRGERWQLGLASLYATVMFGGAAVIMFLTPIPGLGTLGRLAVLVTEHLCLATGIIGILGIIWSVSLADWVERLYRLAYKKLFVFIGIAIAFFALLVILAFFGITFADNP